MALAACGGGQPTPAPTATPAPLPTPDPRIDQVVRQLAELGERLTQLEAEAATPSPMKSMLKVMENATPTPEGMVEPTPTPTADAMVMEEPAIQEVAIIENYISDARFFPKVIVVLKDMPVRLYLTRLHREHVNKFTISPFFNSSAEVLPGQIGVIEFLPDRLGEFGIRNVGHNFEATLVVVESIEEKNKFYAERGKQMFALIHSVDEFRVFPDALVVQKDIPMTVFNIGLIAEHKVSFKPFHDPEDFNIGPRKITPINFTPNTAGDFTIRHEFHGFTGTLTVEEGE